jgi:hypothetical protein
MIAIIVTLVVTTPIAWLWASAIDKQTQYKKQNPNYNEKQGWLDWDN